MGAAGIPMKQSDTRGEHFIEAPRSQVQSLQLLHEKFGSTSPDVLRVPASRRLDHLPRTIDADEGAIGKPLADVGGGNPVSATDLEHAVTWPDIELSDDRAQAVEQGEGSVEAWSTWLTAFLEGSRIRLDEHDYASS